MFQSKVSISQRLFATLNKHVFKILLIFMLLTARPRKNSSTSSQSSSTPKTPERSRTRSRIGVSQSQRKNSLENSQTHNTTNYNRKLIIIIITV